MEKKRLLTDITARLTEALREDGLVSVDQFAPERADEIPLSRFF